MGKDGIKIHPAKRALLPKSPGKCRGRKERSSLTRLCSVHRQKEITREREYRQILYGLHDQNKTKKGKSQFSLPREKQEIKGLGLPGRCVRRSPQADRRKKCKDREGCPLIHQYPPLRGESYCMAFLRHSNTQVGVLLRAAYKNGT